MTVKELIKQLQLCCGEYDVYYAYDKQHRSLPDHIKDERIIGVVELDREAVYLS